MTSPIKFLKGTPDRFNVIEQFAALTPPRKLALCEKLFNENKQAFDSAVRLIWPDAVAGDVSKLEKFLILLKNTAH